MILPPTIPVENWLAKTSKDENGLVSQGLSLEGHLIITGSVCDRVKEIVHHKVREMIPQGMSLLVALHDIGKGTGPFQKKIRKDIENVPSNIKQALSGFSETTENDLELFHAGIGAQDLEEWELPRALSRIIKVHHGFEDWSDTIFSIDPKFGGKEWLELRRQLFERMKKRFGDNLPKISNKYIERMLAGLLVFCDWVSSSKFDDKDALGRVHELKEILPSDMFHSPVDQFNFNKTFGFNPYPNQQLIIDKITPGSLTIYEDRTGGGKTEVASGAAFKLIGQGEAAGFYFALPARGHSDKMLERMEIACNAFYGEEVSVKLLHSTARLKQHQLGKEGGPGGEWFDKAKLGLLAPNAVGTVDQALMGVINTKFAELRLFGLAGKVVILDEVHSYDVYTSTLIKKLVDTLQEIGCTVIILTATLTQAFKAQLLGIKLEELEAKEGSDDYPLLTIKDDKGWEPHKLEVTESRSYDINLVKTTKEALDDAVSKAKEGQQVIFIENTVGYAQETYEELCKMLKGTDVEVGLLHSRFTQPDREKIEGRWINSFSKKGWGTRGKFGRILVGTQILEQSLDLDADAMFTRICPIDMLIQRAGRLWRHNNPNRHPNAKPILTVIAPTVSYVLKHKDISQALKASIVYENYIILRTIQVLENVTLVTEPEAVRGLIESVYKEREKNTPCGLRSGKMAQLKSKLEEKKRAHESRALTSAGKNSRRKPDTQVKTRLDEEVTVPVLLLREMTEVGSGMSITTINGDRLFLPTGAKGLNGYELRNIAIKLQNSCIQTQEYSAPPASPLASLSWLAPYLYTGHKGDTYAYLRIAIVDPQGRIGINNKGKEICYGPEFGYRVQSL